MMSRFMNFVKSACVLLLLAASHAHAVTMDYVGNWAATTTYASGKVVTYNNATYMSLKSTMTQPNKNKVPVSNTAWWQAIGGDAAALAGSVAALQAENTALKARVTTLEANNIAGLSSVLSYDANTKNVLFSGVNVQIVNGLNDTRALNGKGNLIIGYNEVWTNPRTSYCSNGSFKTQSECVSPYVWGINQRSGSHNLILGSSNDYTMWGSIITGVENTANNFESFILGGWGNVVSASGGGILSGSGNIASGPNSTIVGGWNHSTSGLFSTITGGSHNTSSSDGSSVLGGFNNSASGKHSTITGGSDNTSSANASSVTGGFFNLANGNQSSISGGIGLTVEANGGWAAGGNGAPVYSAP